MSSVREDVREIELAYAAYKLLDGIDWREHKRIKTVTATYKYVDGTLIPYVNVEMNDE